MRNVRGVLFLDYVRMLKAHKGVGWEAMLSPADLPFLQRQIDPAGWYPMDTFERLGNAILRFVAADKLLPVQLWGRFSAAQLRASHPMLLAPNDPVETLTRFRVIRETFFDFEALQVLMLHDEEAQIAIHYFMGSSAEQAASYQTLGFFEGLLELAGAKDIRGSFREKAWEGAPRTILDVYWVSRAS